MFESDNKQNNQINQVNFDTQPYQVSNTNQEDTMYYMPDKFIKPENVKNNGGNLIFKLLVIFLVLGVLSVGAFAFYLYKKNNDDTELNQNVLDLEKNQNAEEKVEEISLDTAEKRDQKRIEDIKAIVSAISLYYSQKNNYPGSLSDLSLTLKEIPVNPTPGGENYIYTLNQNRKDYKLTFILEVGANFGNVSLGSGKYQINSMQIVNTYNEDESNNNQNEDNEEDNNNDSNNDFDNDSGIMQIPPKGPDVDNDDFTNAEELLFGTDIDEQDTDTDSYLDGDEIINLYDPLSTTGKLADNITIVKVYYNEIQNYSVLYPAKWMSENRTSDYKETVFYDDKNGDFFTLHVYDNPQAITLLNWYLSSAQGTKSEDLITFNAKKIDGLATKDMMNIYFSANEKVYLLSYKVLNEKELNYYSTFLMFANSFRPIQ
ncbi:MAG: hypothetical protein PHH83_04475 [Patescibacteria group bacterium]|nr:hypothetical protein [Patescibacteria group bacterium]